MNRTGLVEQVRRSGAGAGQVERLKGDERRWSAVQVGIYKGRVGDICCVSMGLGGAEKGKSDMT